MGLRDGRLAFVRVEGAGASLRLPLPEGRVRRWGEACTAPRLSLWGPLAREAEALEKRARHLPQRFGLALLGPAYGSARWVPPGNLPALGEAFEGTAREARELSERAEGEADAVLRSLEGELRTVARRLGLPPSALAVWLEELHENFRPPRLRLSLVLTEIGDTVEEELVRGSVMRRVVPLVRAVADGLLAEMREGLERYLEALRAALDGDGRHVQGARMALRAATERARRMLRAARAEGAEEEVLREVERALEALERVAEATRSLEGAASALMKAEERLREAGLLRTRSWTVACPDCGLVEARGDNPPSSCPRCLKVGVPVLPHPGERG